MPKEQPTIDWSGRNVLVTGGTGMVGSAMVRALLDLGANVCCLIRDPDPTSPLWFSGDINRVSVSAGRIECLEHIRTALNEREIDTVFHLGAQAVVGSARRDPRATFESNIRGTYNLLEGCRLLNGYVNRILIASSDKAYGTCPDLPYSEDAPLHGSNPYDVSKSCVDLIAQSYHASYGLPIAIARCGNIYGPGDRNWSRLVPGTIRSALRGERPLIRSDGSPRRDYLALDDAVNAYLALAQWLDDPDNSDVSQRAFNFGPGTPVSVLEMTQRILIAADCADLEPTVLNEAVGEIDDQWLDATRARTVLGWTPRTPMDQALKRAVDWYRAYLKPRGSVMVDVPFRAPEWSLAP